VAVEAVRLAEAKFPDGEHQNRARCEALLPHTRAVLGHASELGPSMRDCAALLHNVDFFGLGQERYVNAQERIRSVRPTTLCAFTAPALALLDSGAEVNVVSLEFARKMHMPISKNFDVSGLDMMANPTRSVTWSAVRI
jgi:hypothetical protein